MLHRLQDRGTSSVEEIADNTGNGAMRGTSILVPVVFHMVIQSVGNVSQSSYSFSGLCWYKSLVITSTDRGTVTLLVGASACMYQFSAQEHSSTPIG